MNTIRKARIFSSIGGKEIRSKFNREDVLKFVTEDSIEIEERLERLREIESINEDIILYNKILERKKTEETRQRLIDETKIEIKQKEREMEETDKYLKEKFGDKYMPEYDDYDDEEAKELDNKSWQLHCEIRDLNTYVKRCSMTDEELVHDIVKNTFSFHFLEPVLEACKYPCDNPSWVENELSKIKRGAR